MKFMVLQFRALKGLVAPKETQPPAPPNCSVLVLFVD